MVKILKLAALLLVIAIACAGCVPEAPPPSTTQEAPELQPTEPNNPNSNDTPTPSPATETPPPSPVVPLAPTAAPTPITYGPNNFPANINPLTGQMVSDTTLLERRPLAIKVQIFPRGQRPAWGVSQADIVYDFYQNNGMTRLHTLFYGQNAETVGPIRSARLLDLQLIKMYKSIFAFGGAEYRTRSRLFNSEFADRLVVEGGRDTCPPLCRIEPNGPNYLVANTQELTNYANERGIDNTRQDLDGMSFNELAPAGGEQGEQVFIRYSISAYVRWDYDPTSGRYLRFQDTVETHTIEGEIYAPFTDRSTNQQVAADNVVIVVAPHQYAFNTSPGPGEVVEMAISGSGTAYAFRQGQVYAVTWNRPQNNSVLSLTFPDGRPFPFKPGNTWFQLVGISSKIEPMEAGTWRIQFYIP